jgi:hypothetical protein
VPSVTSDAGALGSSDGTPAATWAVTVAATSVWISSTTPTPVVAGAASSENPHEMIWSWRVAGVEICKRVFIEVPVVTFTGAAVFGEAALKHL